MGGAVSFLWEVCSKKIKNHWSGNRKSNVTEHATLLTQQKEHRPSKPRTKDRVGGALLRLAHVATPK